MSPCGDRAIAGASEAKSSVECVEVPDRVARPQPSIRDSDCPGNTVVDTGSVVGHDCRIDIQVREIPLKSCPFHGGHRSRHTRLRNAELIIRLTEASSQNLADIASYRGSSSGHAIWHPAGR